MPNKTTDATTPAKKPTAAELKKLAAAQAQAQREERDLVAKIAKAREGGMSGAAIRAEFGEEWTGPRRVRAFRKYGHEGLIKGSYDRDAAKAAREAAAAERAKKPAKAKA